jgi:catechol 2,3-dioxygenase-like lactoylglutathione lyase family enzyme
MRVLWGDTAYAVGQTFFCSNSDYDGIRAKQPARRDDDNELYAVLDRAGAAVIAGPVRRIGGRGQGMSLYTRDPDNNLLEFIVYESRVE